MQKHFVTFYSPGTFVHEETTKEIDFWSVETAVAMAEEITERYAAKPFGFQFTTRTRADNELDSKVTDTSPMYYLGGKVETIKSIEKRNDPKDAILLSNMKGNGWDRVIVNTNSWKVTVPFKAGDVLLEV